MCETAFFLRNHVNISKHDYEKNRKLSSPALIDHINRRGKTIYQRKEH